MICKTCGSAIPDDAVKCDVCGVKVYRKNSGVASQRLKMLGVGAGIGLVVVGALAVPAFLGSTPSASADTSARVATNVVTQKELIVPVQASGLDESGSRIPVHVKGLTSGGMSVDQNGYVNHEGKGLSLEQGTYEVSVVGSPISSSGVIYNVPTTSATVEVSAEGGSSYTTGTLLALTPVDAASVTDEQIEAARQWVAGDSERSAFADHLVETVRQKRDTAQRAATGASAKKEETEQHADNQSEQSSGGSNDSSGQSSDDSNQSQSDSSYYPYYAGNYDYSQSSNGGNTTESAQDSGGTPSSDAPQPDTSQDSGQSGQQVDPAPSDTSSGGGSGSSDTQGSSSDQGGSSSQPAADGSNTGGANAGGAASAGSSGATA